MESYFDHEKLRVYQESLKFVEWNEQILKKLPKKLSVWSQLDAASTSIVLNIAEGNGKFTPKDRCKFFDGFGRIKNWSVRRLADLFRQVKVSCKRTRQFCIDVVSLN